MAAMKAPLRLRLEPRPSRVGRVAIIAGCVATALVVALTPLPLAAVVAGVAAIIAAGARGLWRCSGSGVPALLHVGIDRRLTVTGRDGRSCAGAIVDDSYVGAMLTTIVWRADRQPWWRPAHTILVLPDTLAEDDFRKLRVFLRYGRSAAEATSAVDAG
jgi:toxin CptA